MQNESANFKRCTLCATEWRTREEFLSDPDTRFDGYLYHKERVRTGLPPEGMLIFTHRTSRCGTSLAIAASRFKQVGEPSL